MSTKIKKGFINKFKIYFSVFIIYNCVKGV